MYCIFDLHKNQENLDYYVGVENKTAITDKRYAQLDLPAGDYIKVELLKRNNKTVFMIMMYIKNLWIKRNGLKERNAPAFIVYDDRFHTNYQKFGCKGDDYLGYPVSVLYIPIIRYI